MRVKIYQINPDRDTDRTRFLGSDERNNLFGDLRVNPAEYDEVFNAVIDETDLEDMFRRFNTVGHPLHRGYSMSVSDVVVTENGAFFCDSIGFKKIEFDESLTQKPDNLMKIVYKEPGKPAYDAEISNNLKSLQNAVGGFIECVYNDDSTVIVCNEEGKLQGLQGNIHLDNGTSIIAGSFFICGDGGEDFCSLTEQQTEKYINKYSEPENISQEETESDMGLSIIEFN